MSRVFYFFPWRQVDVTHWHWADFGVDFSCSRVESIIRSGFLQFYCASNLKRNLLAGIATAHKLMQKFKMAPTVIAPMSNYRGFCFANRKQKSDPGADNNRARISHSHAIKLLQTHTCANLSRMCLDIDVSRQLDWRACTRKSSNGDVFRARHTLRV